MGGVCSRLSRLWQIRHTAAVICNVGPVSLTMPASGKRHTLSSFTSGKPQPSITSASTYMMHHIRGLERLEGTGSTGFKRHFYTFVKLSPPKKITHTPGVQMRAPQLALQQQQQLSHEAAAGRQAPFPGSRQPCSRITLKSNQPPTHTV